MFDRCCPDCVFDHSKRSLYLFWKQLSNAASLICLWSFIMHNVIKNINICIVTGHNIKWMYATAVVKMYISTRVVFGPITYNPSLSYLRFPFVKYNPHNKHLSKIFLLSSLFYFTFFADFPHSHPCRQILAASSSPHASPFCSPALLLFALIDACQKRLMFSWKELAAPSRVTVLLVLAVGTEMTIALAANSLNVSEDGRNGELGAKTRCSVTNNYWAWTMFSPALLALSFGITVELLNLFPIAFYFTAQ